MQTVLWTFSLTVIYFFIALAFLLTFIKQVKLLREEFENGLQYYRKALTTIVGVYMLDALYLFIAFVFLSLGNVEHFQLMIYSITFVVVKSFVAGGAWLYVFLYRGSTFEWLSIEYWKEKL